VSTYSGRLGKICDRIRWQANLSSGNSMATEAELLDLVNQCQADMARSLVYRKEALLDVEAGDETIDLADVAPDLYELYGLLWVDTKKQLLEVQNETEAKKARLYFEPGIPRAYHRRENDLILIPAPASAATDAVAVIYYYVPDDLTGSTAAAGPPVVLDGTTPIAIHETDDDIFVKFGLWKLFGRDRLLPLSREQSSGYYAEYERHKSRLKSKTKRSGRIVPYR
jgi:hypothetical protein